MASFSSVVKSELSNIEPGRSCCVLAEVAGSVCTNARAQPDGSMIFVTENSAVARRLFKLLKELYTEIIQVSYMSSFKFKKHTNYTLTVPVEAVSVLKNDMKQLTINQDQLCCARAYLRGVFSAVGSVSDPQKSYHLELAVRNIEVIEPIIQCFNLFALNPHVIQRKNNHVIYIKEADQIVDFLNIVQAHKALLKYEDVRVLKSVRNDVNRLVNCETANLDKTVDAAVRQIEYIKQLQQNGVLYTLPEPLQQIARLRLENPDASLKELGEMANPPVGKSGVNHRLKKLEQIAESSGNNENQAAIKD
ncbi:MAG TPA: DNA-binding protein WhiA [Clostridiales bacterium]|nr:DNA-binding protein WhiA [Clostridiales bacterium]